jgi:chemosensory pili system protein ChpA (sensor histidine kinase/response regulator)
METSPLDRPMRSGALVPTILCIDDDPEVSGGIERQLRDYDVRVIRAFHGMHGYAEALAHRPDVIVTDLRMPSGDGATILECLRRNRQTVDVPVIVLTGMRDRRLRHKLQDLGANAFLYKPLPPDELIQTLRRFVELRECHMELTCSGG